MYYMHRTQPILGRGRGVPTNHRSPAATNLDSNASHVKHARKDRGPN
jgi:hypothetical protein